MWRRRNLGPNGSDAVSPTCFQTLLKSRAEVVECVLQLQHSYCCVVDVTRRFLSNRAITFTRPAGFATRNNPTARPQRCCTLMKHCHPHNILWYFYNTWQQVGKWLLLTGANGKITHIWKAVLCVVLFNSRWARSLLLLRGLWKHRCNMCQSSSSLREDTVVAILILHIADTTVALLHNLDASLCAIKVMQHGLHKGTS